MVTPAGSVNANLVEGVDPIKIRMIGAIFWAGLLVYFVPIWFMNPVMFSPDAPKPVLVTSTPALAEAVGAPKLAEVENFNSLPSEVPERSQLFIDKPLTTTPPLADPEKAQRLRQSVHLRETTSEDLSKGVTPSNLSKQVFAGLPAANAQGHVYLQVATYTVESVALDSMTKLKARGLSVKMLTQLNKNKKTVFILRVGPYLHVADAQKVKVAVDKAFKTKSMILGK